MGTRLHPWRIETKETELIWRGVLRFERRLPSTNTNSEFDFDHTFQTLVRFL